MCRPLAFSSTDLKGCYDTVAQNRLLQAVAFSLRLLVRTATPALVQTRFHLARLSAPHRNSCVVGATHDAALGTMATVAARWAYGAHCDRIISEEPIAPGQSLFDAFGLLRQHILCHVVEGGG